MINWDNLLQAIREDKCVILLCPNMLEIQVEGEDRPLHPYLMETLRSEHARDLLAYYEQDELFLFRKDSAKNESYFTLKGRLKKHPLAPGLLRKLAAVRLHLLLSFSPYLNPAQTFPRLEILYPFRFGFYHMKRGAEGVAEPTAERPLLYDLFGSIEEEESLILTYADLFEYIKSILGARELDTGLKAALQRTRYFIFLGFQFEKWYVQLMLRLLRSINDNHSAYTWVPRQAEVDPEVMDVLTEEFDIRIIRDQEGARSFVDQLHERCAEVGLLRPDPSEGAGPYEQIKQMLEQDNLEDAAEFLTDHFEANAEEELVNEAINLSGQISRLARKERQGILTQEEAGIARNKLRRSLQSLNEELRA